MRYCAVADPGADDAEDKAVAFAESLNGKVIRYE